MSPGRHLRCLELLDDVARPYFVVRLDGPVVDVYESLVGGFLYAVARGVVEFLAHELVDAQGCLPGVADKAEVFVELSAFVLLEFFYLGAFAVEYQFVVSHVVGSVCLWEVSLLVFESSGVLFEEAFVGALVVVGRGMDEAYGVVLVGEAVAYYHGDA